MTVHPAGQNGGRFLFRPKPRIDAPGTARTDA